VTLHILLPLVAFVLNVTLLALVLVRDHRSRTNQVLALLLGALATWNLGVFMLRRSPDAESALRWEYLVHLGVIPVAGLFYHFIVLFLNRASRRHRLVAVGYILTASFLVVLALDLLGAGPSPWFLAGVTWTNWGYVPAGGPLYRLFFGYFQIFMLLVVGELALALGRTESSFRRNRTKLIFVGTVVSLLGGYVDFLRFIVPALEWVYPLGLPLNAVFALCLGVAVVRYRLVDVGVATKRVAIYGGLVSAMFPLVVGFAAFAESRWRMQYRFSLGEDLVLAFVLAMALTPLTRSTERWIDHVIFRKTFGVQQTLSDLRGRMGSFVDVSRLADTVVDSLVTRIPLTHGALYLQVAGTGDYRVQRVASSGALEQVWHPLAATHPVVTRLREHDSILIMEEIDFRADLAAALAGADGPDLADMHLALLIALRSEGKLLGILALGEKLSGDVFGTDELELLEVLAGQATIALQTSRLYEQLKHSNEQLVEADRQRSRFVAQFSHELRTPLNSIIGFSKMLLRSRDARLTDDEADDLAAIHDNGLHLLNLINDVLDFSKIESAAIELSPEEVDLAALLEECVRFVRPVVHGRRVAIHQRVASGVPPLHVDRTKIRQVLLNLLSNAVKFTPEGEVIVSIEPRDDHVAVAVADSGIGIRAEDQARLFQPFSQVTTADMHLPLGGTGLGLVISKTFVELHGGTIRVESRPGQGSTFVFTLPLEPAAVLAGTGHG
jgi:signal transduction histidine kinase